MFTDAKVLISHLFDATRVSTDHVVLPLHIQRVCGSQNYHLQEIFREAARVAIQPADKITAQMGR
jgi:hypothetical protein